MMKGDGSFFFGEPIESLIFALKPYYVLRFDMSSRIRFVMTATTRRDAG